MCAQFRLGAPLGPRPLPPRDPVRRRLRRVYSPPRAQQEHQERQQADELPALQRPPVRRPPPPPSRAAEQRAGMTAARRAAAAAAAAAQQRGRTIRLAVIGDVHSQWSADSAAALESLGADVAIFVGDFGEEDVPLIRAVAALPHPKAVVLGNHDAWFSLTPRGRQRYVRALAAGTAAAVHGGRGGGGDKGAGSTPAIAAQLDALGEDHIGYASKRFPHLGLTLLGGRPFSKGGRQWSDVADFYAEQYGVGGHRDSALRMLDVALSAPEEDVKVLVAHNGPTGLGARRHSICGVDWTEPEADHGDPDLQEALEMVAAQGLRLPLVLFGHMHSQLKGSGLRNRAEVHPQTGTLYLNAAVVPRIRPLPAPPRDGHHSGGGAGGNGSSSSGSPRGSSGEAATIRSHHFTVVEMRQGVVAAARDVWVGVERCEAGGGERRCMVVRQQELVKTSLAAAEAAAEGAAARAAGNGSGSNGNGAAAAAAAALEPGRQAAADAAAAEADAAAAAERGDYVCSIYRAHTGEWEPFVLQLPAAAAAAAAAELAA